MQTSRGVYFNDLTILGNDNSLGAYPIGSIYMSALPISPAKKFGGTWEQIMGKFLFTSDDILNTKIENEELEIITNGNYHINDEGGSADATLVYHTHQGGYTFDGSYSIINKGVKQSGDFYALSIIGSPEGHFITAPYVGEDGTGKNMPPYLVVYIWKRCA